MKFRWYHAAIILLSVICAAGFVMIGMNFSNRVNRSDTASSSEALKARKSKPSKKDNANKKAADSTGTTQVPKLPAPELECRMMADGTVKLTWSTVTGAEYYEVFRYDDLAEKWSKQKKTLSLSWKDINVEDGYTYRYRVYATRENDGAPVRGDYAAGTVHVDTTVKALVVDKKTNSSKRMVKYLKKAGFEVELVGSLSDFRVEDYDTLVIPGGHNITPSIYGAERDEHTYGTDEEIDNLQIDAINLFKEAEKPVLGVCRGCQVVNVALGGTINQHIPGWHKKYRTVTIDPKSWLYSKLGAEESVYHYHHQCVDELGEGLIATQWDEEDERVEAIEHETLPIYGIQWHPDSMGDKGVEIFTYYKDLVMEYKTEQ